MSWLRATFVRFRSLFRKRQLDRELNAELTGHLELHIADNLRAGMTPEAAPATRYSNLAVSNRR